MLVTTGSSTAKPIYFTGNDGPTIWVGDTGGPGVAPVRELYSGVANGVVGIDESEGELMWATARSASVVKGASDGSSAPTEMTNGRVGGAAVQLDVAIDRPRGRYFYAVTQGGSGVAGLYEANLDGSGAPTLIDVGVGPTGVIYDAANDYIYYSTNTNIIRRIRPDGTDQEDILTSSVDTFCDITADFAAGLLYFTVNLDTVGVLDLETGARTTLFDPVGTVRSVDLDVSTQTLYWAAFGVSVGVDTVQSGAADGTGGITTLYEGDFHALRGLAVSSIPEPGAALLLLFATTAGVWTRK